MKKRWLDAALVAVMACGMFACGITGTAVTNTSGGDGQEEVYEASLPKKAEEADIYVEPIKGLAEDFIKGMDVSSVIAEEQSGVVYYNEAGEEEDLFRVLADAGVNYIRVRVWNDPYDKDGNGYGGGNSDVAKAAEIGKRAARYGMKLLVDFHYSDLWADPAKQFAPKAWAHLSLADKQKALYDFTKESMQTILDSGADVGMVQIGNEINNGMAGETDWERICPLLAQGSKAVREIASSNGRVIKIAVHFTDIDDHDQTIRYAQTLADAGLDYDVFGVSYYPYWHGTMENLTTVLKDVRNSFDKETIILETSYCYTLEDGDGAGNSVGEEDDLPRGYAATVQSQATCVRDVMAAGSAASSLGVFYWEGAWIPVGTPEQLAENQKLWEQYGSGWASSYAGKYDKDDAGQYYGGCSWDNQALFDAEGHPLPSLDVFKYVDHGANCELAVDFTEDCELSVSIGDVLRMPETIDVCYNDRSFNGPADVAWDAAQAAGIDTARAGEYTVAGTLEDGTSVNCLVKVENKNWVQNPGFEQNDISMWKVSYEGSSNPTDIQEKEADASSGLNSFHFWDDSQQEFSVEQTVSGLEAGSYTASVHIQGGDVGASAEICLYVVVDGERIQSEPVTLDGWCNWQTPEIAGIEAEDGGELTVGVSVKCAAGGWGTIDDFLLERNQ